MQYYLTFDDIQIYPDMPNEEISKPIVFYLSLKM